jgi:nucleoside 2-deoxyribosyltransferase
MLNNFGHLILLFTCYILYQTITLPGQPYYFLHLGAIVLASNTIIDFVINWSFYFPGSTAAARSGSRMIFLAAPFTQTLDDSTKQVSSEYRKWLEKLIRHLESHGDQVFSAHTREQWGTKLDEPAHALKADMHALEKSDWVIALVGDPPSPGVQMELGAALLLNKRIAILVKRGEFVPYLVRGLNTLPYAQTIEYSNEDEAMAALSATLKLPA